MLVLELSEEHQGKDLIRINNDGELCGEKYCFLFDKEKVKRNTKWIIGQVLHKNILAKLNNCGL